MDALRRLGVTSPIPLDLVRLTNAITQDHGPDLIRMARDRHLFAAPSDSSDVWAPIHALDQLAELDLRDHSGDLIPLFDLEGDWLSDSTLPELFATIGPPALPYLRAYLHDPSRWGWGHFTAARALQKIAAGHPATRAEAVATLTAMLDALDAYGETSCTAAMDMLVELDAVEALPQIRRAFAHGKIDEMLRGDWATVLADLGYAPDPDDPLVGASAARFEARQDQFVPRELRQRLAAFGAGQVPAPPPPRPASRSAPALAPRRAPSEPQRAAGSADERARKAKQKRKQQAASGKANRKRK